MLFIHHHGDTEQEAAPPERIRHVAKRWCETGAPTLAANMRGFVRATGAQIGQVMANPETCGSNYWEIVVEATDL